MLPFSLSHLFRISNLLVGPGESCACSSVVIPVHVDVVVPTDPTDIFGGLKSNASSLRRVDATYNIFGTFCQPDAVSAENSDTVQILVHGFTYTGQYWSPPVEEFRNYSYAAFSCDHGLSSLAVDSLGVGLSSRPGNAADVQYPTSSAALSQVARHLKSSSILPGIRPFKKVIGIGHSAGSAMLNFGAIVEGAQSPFDGLIFTGALTVEPGEAPTLPPLPPARDDTPLRWGSLDPMYITTSNRTLFYPPNPTAFSPRMMVYDDFTKDVGSVSTVSQTPITSLTAHYAGSVAKVVGSEDQLVCAGTDRCLDVAGLVSAERVGWPEAKSFDVIVAHGSGHSLNLDFMANGPFTTFVDLVKKFSRF
ncbi:hypothetical protein DFH06DRAFT_1300613 [Mycena polygramma]|nr:hypothetical protein DFH06DRAFT_1300613 [Mycena polygramma]